MEYNNASYPWQYVILDAVQALVVAANNLEGLKAISKDHYLNAFCKPKSYMVSSME
jgi:hypothetical protein